MELLFTEQKWNILKNLSEQCYSPLQLAEKSNTTIANISQQLRLLEAASLVKKEKIPNREKGKPRTLFSLRKDYAYLISTMDGFAEKKLIELDSFHAYLLRIFYVTDPEDHYFLLKFTSKIDRHFDYIDMIVYQKDGKDIKLTVVTEEPKELEKIKETEIRRNGGTTKKIRLDIVSEKEIRSQFTGKRGIFSSPDKYVILHDQRRILAKGR